MPGLEFSVPTFRPDRSEKCNCHTIPPTRQSLPHQPSIRRAIRHCCQLSQKLVDLVPDLSSGHTHMHKSRGRPNRQNTACSRREKTRVHSRDGSLRPIFEFLHSAEYKKAFQADILPKDRKSTIRPANVLRGSAMQSFNCSFTFPSELTTDTGLFFRFQNQTPELLTKTKPPDWSRAQPLTSKFIQQYFYLLGVPIVA